MKLLLFMIIIVVAVSCQTPQTGDDKTVAATDTCASRHDTTFYSTFTRDTTTTDFYALLNFIESKGEFTRFNAAHAVDSATTDTVVLKRVLCWGKQFDSPIEYWRLQHIFSISYFMSAVKPSANKGEDQPGFRIRQLNFTSNREMELAAAKIQDIHWGEPLLAWNVWFLVKGNRRIYMLENYIPAFTETTKRYSELIQREWVKQAAVTK